MNGHVCFKQGGALRAPAPTSFSSSLRIVAFAVVSRKETDTEAGVPPRDFSHP